MSIYYVGRLPKRLYLLFHLSQPASKAGTGLFPILQMRKLKFKVK